MNAYDEILSNKSSLEFEINTYRRFQVLELLSNIFPSSNSTEPWGTWFIHDVISCKRGYSIISEYFYIVFYYVHNYLLLLIDTLI